MATSTRPVVAIALAAVLACSPAAAQAANECRVTISHFGDGSHRRTPLTTVATLDVGDVSVQELDWLDYVRNEGPHDVRVSFSGAPGRQMARGQTDPATGRYSGRVKLLRLECLPSRSALQRMQPPQLFQPAVPAVATAPLTSPRALPQHATPPAQRSRAHVRHPL
jgi:hypothetical protein